MTLLPDRPSSPKPPSRVGKKAVTAYVDPELHKTIRRLALEQDTSTQQLLIDAVTDYLQRHAG